MESVSITPRYIYYISTVRVRGDRISSVHLRRFKSIYGVSPPIVSMLWRKIHSELPRNSRAVHLLWSLRWLKTYSTEHVCCDAEDCDEKTFRKWVPVFVEKLSDLNLICFDSRFVAPPFNRCLMTIDGTDVPIQEPSPLSPDWYTYKLNRAGLRYEVGVSINDPNICWVNGPFKPGVMTDLMIFQSRLKQELEERERVGADRHYADRKCFTKNTADGNNYIILSNLLARHEKVNGILKRFNVLNHNFRHNLDFHQNCFYAVANIAHIIIKEEEPLF